MMPTLYLNARFLSQPFSGVQRFATEMTAALQRRYPGRVVLLAPPGTPIRDVPLRIVGRRSGQLWEQVDLPFHVADGVLVNLGNTAPLRVRAQIVVIHDAGVFATPEAYAWRFRLWYKFLHRRLVHSGTRIATVSQFARDQLVRFLGASKERICVLPEGADHMPGLAADKAVLDRLPSARFVLAVGNLAAHKNLAALGPLAGALASRGVSLVVTGSLPTGSFRTLRSNALPQPACYVGRVSDGALKALYEAALCLVFPSRYEGYGLPAVEAMACGCAVAAADIQALRETCGAAAVFFPPDNPMEIAQTVCGLVDDPDRRAALRDAGAAHVRGLTWARAAERLGSVVKEVSKEALLF